MKLTHLILVAFALVGLWTLSLNPMTLEENNTLMSSLIDPFFNLLKSVLSAILDFFGELFGGLL